MRLWPRKRVYVDDLPKTHDVRFGFLFLVLFVGVLGLLYVVGYFVAGDKVPTRTSVAGIDIGGMSRAHATTVLQHRLAPRADRPVTVDGTGAPVLIEPQQAGMTMDVKATLDQAMAGGDWDPRHMLRVLTGGGAVDPVVVTDRAELARALKPIAAKVERKPVDAQMRFETARPVLVAGQPGQQLDIDRTGSRLRSALVEGRRRITLVTRPVQPQVTSTEMVRFIDGTVDKAMSGPVTVVVSGHELTVQPNRFGPALRATVVGHKLRLGIDASVLSARTHWRKDSLPGRPVDAQIEFRSGRPVVEPGSPGQVIPRKEWATAVLRAATSPRRTATATAVRAQPGFTTTAARSLDINRRIGGGSARADRSFASAVFRKARSLDGALLRPRETFSLLDRIGRSAEPRADSVVGTALYLAVKEAGLPVRDATVVGSGIFVSPPSRDLKFRDSRHSGIYIRCIVRGRFAPLVHVELWGGSS